VSVWHGQVSAQRASNENNDYPLSRGVGGAAARTGLRPLHAKQIPSFRAGQSICAHTRSRAVGSLLEETAPNHFWDVTKVFGGAWGNFFQKGSPERFLCNHTPPHTFDEDDDSETERSPRPPPHHKKPLDALDFPFVGNIIVCFPLRSDLLCRGTTPSRKFS